jgi:hypothetical protein
MAKVTAIGYLIADADPNSRAQPRTSTTTAKQRAKRVESSTVGRPPFRGPATTPARSAEYKRPIAPTLPAPRRGRRLGRAAAPRDSGRAFRPGPGASPVQAPRPAPFPVFAHHHGPILKIGPITQGDHERRHVPLSRRRVPRPGSPGGPALARSRVGDVPRRQGSAW